MARRMTITLGNIVFYRRGRLCRCERRQAARQLGISCLVVSLWVSYQCLTASSCEAQAIVPLQIAISHTTPVPGQAVTFSWTLKNTGQLPLMGNIAASFNFPPGNPVGPINTKTLMPGKSMSGTYSVLPRPGWNVFSVQMLYTHSVTVYSDSTTHPLQPLAPGQDPTPRSPPTSHSVPVVSAVAQGSTSFDASPASSAIAAVLSTAQRRQIMQDYAPLLLFSYDHGSEETYAPTDVISFAKLSSLTGSARTTDLSDPFYLLDPNQTGASGTITANQTALPARLFVKPSPVALKGDDWADIMQRQEAGQDIGLYSRALLVDVANLNDEADPTLKQRLLARYNCKYGAACAAQVIKIEYWQFFGFSYDYDGDSLGSVGKAIEEEVNHDGDWCAVTLYVDAAWWLSARPDQAILSVYHYLHGIQAGFDLAATVYQPHHVAVPARSIADTAPIYPALEYDDRTLGRTRPFPSRLRASGCQ